MAQAVSRQHITMKTGFYTGLNHVTLVADKLFLQSYQLRLLLVCHSTSTPSLSWYLLITYQKDKGAKSGDLQTKICPSGYRAALDRKVLSRLFWRGGCVFYEGWSPFFSVSHVLHIPTVSYGFPQPNETDEPCLYLAVCLSIPHVSSGLLVITAQTGVAGGFDGLEVNTVAVNKYNDQS